ncbi:hypothetical protein HPB50_007216 [Hyalomma asiaticum]|uniref:Uncharacterized protein n=1 Tax=Hyalomma asiaticum TaxID=266040 RepID=A0ACB7S9X0_HYAAI|nr:hypothetical protein HPB50_007216 [Hyalomma asiaticum]
MCALSECAVRTIPARVHESSRLVSRRRASPTEGIAKHELRLTCQSSELQASPKAMTGSVNTGKARQSRHAHRRRHKAKSPSNVASVTGKSTTPRTESPARVSHKSLLSPRLRTNRSSTPRYKFGSGGTPCRDPGLSPAIMSPCSAGSADAMSPASDCMSPSGRSIGSREGMSPAGTTDNRFSLRPDAGFLSPDAYRIAQQGIMSPSDPLSPYSATRSKTYESRSLIAYGAEEQRELLFTYVAVALTVLAFCALLTAALLLVVPAGPQDTVCTTASCSALDSLLASSVDQTRDPCVNFYAHVCSGWAQSHNQSVYRSHLREFLEDVDGILARVLVPSQAQTASQIVAAFYQTCTAVLVDGVDELPSFRRQLRLAGVSWPLVSVEPDLVATAASVYATFQVTAILRIRPSRRNTSNVLEVAPDLAFLRGWKRTRQQLIRAGAYARFFEETKTKYAGKDGATNAAINYEMFSDVEDTVLQALVHRGQSGGEVRVSRIDSLVQFTRNVPTTTWRAVIDKLGLPESALVIIANLELIKKVDDLFTTLGEERLHYYLGWCVVQQMMRYISKGLANSLYDYEGVIDMATDMRARAECMQLSEKLVGQFTFGRFLIWKTDAEDYLYVSSVVGAVSGQLMHVIGSRNGPKLRAADFHVEFHEDAMRVVDEALGKYGLSNGSSLLSNWMDIAAAVSTINATFRDRIATTYTKDLVAEQRYNLYNNRRGALSLPPFFAMLPVYRKHLSDTTKYGALGTLFATAIFRLFLDKLASYSVEFEGAIKALRCFAELAEYRSDGLERYHHAASVTLALEALRSLPSRDHQRLRMFDSLQVFFVVMCYLFCTPNTPEDTIIAETICNEAVKNSREFAMAFQCSPGSLMNPEQRCHFF